MPVYGWEEILRRNRHSQETVKQRVDLNKDRLKKLRSSGYTKSICYPQYNAAFDYVHALYPFAHVKTAQVYYVPRWLSEDVGYTGAGGFYDTQSRIIVVTDCVAVDDMSPLEITAELEPDEVLCHELIHFAANARSPLSSRNVEEEIAYGKSVPYLRRKGHDDDFIIRKNMMPYLVSCVNKWETVYQVLRASGKTMQQLTPEWVEQNRARIEGNMITAAYALGEKIIAAHAPIYDPNKPPANKGNLLNALHRGKNLLLDDDM